MRAGHAIDSAGSVRLLVRVLFLNKLLPVFVLPLGLVTLLVLLGAWRKWRWAAVVAVLGLLAASTPVVSNRLIGRLESVHPQLRVPEAPAADVVLVLGGMLGAPKAEGFLPEWSEAADRFEGGVALLRAGKAQLLLFTGAPRSRDGSVTSEGEELRAQALARGVAETAVQVTGRVENTADEIRELERLCAARGATRVLLVTSAWHMPRAMRQLRRTPLQVTAFPVDFRARPNRALPYLDWIPTASALANTELALRECYGMAFYTVLGR